PGLLRSLFQNLIENAIKFSPREGRVDVALANAGPNVRVQVRDQGPGIAADELPRIFGRFYRVNPAKGAAEGTGLGLAIARRIVVQSAEGKGTTFSVEIKKL